MTALDAITLGVVQSGLQQVCNEMDLAFVRAAFSPVISEGLDRSDGIYAREDGKLIAQGELGSGLRRHDAVLDRASDRHQTASARGRRLRRERPLSRRHPPDGRALRAALLLQGRAFRLALEHRPLAGHRRHGAGRLSRRAPPRWCREGLRFPPIKLYKEGRIDEELLSVILSNIRVPEQRIGDIEAQSAALLVGARRMTALLDKYGVPLVEDVIREMRARAARQMRAKITTIPDGSYRGLAQVDSDGVVDEPLTSTCAFARKIPSSTSTWEAPARPAPGP